MKLQRIQIEQQMVRIKIESQRAALRIQQGKRQMEVRREPGKLTVERRMGKINIDQSPIKNITARKDPMTLQKDFAAQSFAAARQGTHDIARNGDMVAEVPYGDTSRISDLARMKLMNPPKPDPGFGMVPKTPVHFDGDPGELSIDWTPQTVEIIWGQVAQPTFTVDPKPSVEVEVVQRADVQLSLVEMSIPAETGQTIDVKV
ncbi:MAG: hypothetical protein E7472_00905 [Ruminococcaceae bacterium]|nr:hypothetical protein [Oscillospiraceae bacterium]